MEQNHKRTFLANFRPITVLFCFVVASLSLGSTFPTAPDEYPDNTEYRNIGVQQLSSWILAQLKQGDAPLASDTAQSYRIPLINTKRNSELTSSIMGLPRTMIHNGKK